MKTITKSARLSMNSKTNTLLGAVLFLLVICAAAPSAICQAQTAKLFVSECRFDQGTELYRYEVGPAGVPTLDLILTHPSINNPYGLALSPTGEMFVVNRGPLHGFEGSVSRFLNPGGSPLFNGTIDSMPPTFSFTNPHGAGFRRGELFIPQNRGGNALRFVFDAAGAAFFNGAITEGLADFHPRNVTENPATGELFIVETGGVNEINRYLFDAAGNAIPNGVINEALNYPHDLAFSPWGELFVTNTGNNNILRFKFDAMGTASFNGEITGNGLTGPIGLDFSPWGELFVSSFDAPVISRWTFDASFNAIPNGSFDTPQTLGDLQFLPDNSPACAAQVQPPINADGTSIFNVRRGVVPVKFRLTCDGSPTCDLPPATIAVTRTAGGVIGQVNESVYSGPADSGPNFRVLECQYHYNLNSSALGAGMYRVDILIDGQVVGSASFELR